MLRRQFLAILASIPFFGPRWSPDFELLTHTVWPAWEEFSLVNGNLVTTKRQEQMMTVRPRNINKIDCVKLFTFIHDETPFKNHEASFIREMIDIRFMEDHVKVTWVDCRKEFALQ